MAVRKRKPTSPGRRFQSVSDFADITTDKPEKSLTHVEAAAPAAATPTVARPRVTAVAAHKRLYRIVDFKREKDGIPAKVASIEYDPNRNARIALLHYRDGEKRYILAPPGLEGRRHAAERSRLGDPRRQRDAAALHPRRYHGAQRRVEAGRGRQDRPRRRRRDPAHREGRRVRDAAAALHRDAPGPDRLPRHHWFRRQRRGRARSRSARRAATAGRVCARRPAASP